MNYTAFTQQQWLAVALLDDASPPRRNQSLRLYRRNALTWALLLSCVLTYIPIGLCMGTGYITFGPRYLLDLTVPLVVLTAICIRRWRLDVLYLLLAVSCITYAIGSTMWALFVY